MESDRARFEPLVRRFAPRATLTRAQSLEGGISARSTLLELAEDGAERSVVVRETGAARRTGTASEFAVLSAVHLAGLPVNEPIYLDASGEALGTPAYVTAYTPGVAEYAPSDPVEFARRLAPVLARIHAVPETARRDSGLPGFVERGRSRLAARTERDESLQESRIRGLLEPRLDTIERNERVLLHGDFWPGNLIWREGNLAAVLDWEDAAVGDPLADLAITRLDMLWMFGRPAMDAFTTEYFAVAPTIDSGLLPCWDLAAALRPVGDLDGWAAGFPALGRPDITYESMLAGHVEFVDEAIGALDGG